MYYGFRGTLNKIGIEEGNLYIKVTGDVNHQLKWKDENYNVFITCNDDNVVSSRDNIILKEEEKLFIEDSKFENLLSMALDKGKMISISIKEINTSLGEKWEKVIKRVKHYKEDNGEAVIIEDEQIIETKTNSTTKYSVKKIEVSK